MYFSTDYVQTAIKKLSAVHPFYGITFLACKKNRLSVGTPMDYPMDLNNKLFLDAIHKINPSSEFYFQPYNSNSLEKKWLQPKYPSAGLQAINTQTFGQAFIHVKKQKTWCWAPNYVDVIASLLKNNRPLSIFDLAVWVFKDKDWAPYIDTAHVLEYFLTEFNITEEEHNSLFTDAIEGYPVTPFFQELPVVWDMLSNNIEAPPDAEPSRGATLSYLQINNLGPTSSMCLEPSRRLNIITGDNGLGKSFLMECAWWALTGVWPDTPAQPCLVPDRKKAAITYELASDKGAPVRKTVNYDSKQGVWIRDKEAPSIPGLIVYARVDGSYAVWDPVKQYSSVGAPKSYVFSRNEVWDGLSGSIEGLVRDWTRWQNAPDKSPFEILVKVLKRMSPPDMGELKPGIPKRLFNDIRDIPTIVHPYGEVPIVNVSAGIRRIITLAYLIVWAWHEHRVSAKLSDTKPENRMVILIDEIEAHLHPKWQRVILPSLLNVQKILSHELEIQFIISTHSPLVLASVESYFDISSDTLFHIMSDKNTGEAELSVIDFIKYGQVNSWLTSPIFNLGHARAQEAEKAIDQAKKLQMQDTPSPEHVNQIHKLLLNELSETDPFWPRWLFFAEKHGVKL